MGHLKTPNTSCFVRVLSDFEAGKNGFQNKLLMKFEGSDVVYEGDILNSLLERHNGIWKIPCDTKVQIFCDVHHTFKLNMNDSVLVDRDNSNLSNLTQIEEADFTGLKTGSVCSLVSETIVFGNLKCDNASGIFRALTSAESVDNRKLLLLRRDSSNQVTYYEGAFIEENLRALRESPISKIFVACRSLWETLSAHSDIIVVSFFMMYSNIFIS